MPNTTPTQNQPLCLVAGIDDFLGVELTKRLQEKHVRVLSSSVQPGSEEVSYVIDTSFLNPSTIHASGSRSKALNLAINHRAKYMCVSLGSLTNVADKKLSPVKADTYRDKVSEWEKTVAAESKKHNLDARLLRVIDVYGPSAPNLPTPLLQLGQKLASGEIIVLGPQDQNCTPLYVADAAELVIRALFSRAGKQKVYTLTGSKSVTLINLSLELQNLAAKAHRSCFITTHPGEKIDLLPVGTPLSPTKETILEAGLMSLIQTIHTTPPPPASPPSFITQKAAPRIIAPAQKIPRRPPPAIPGWLKLTGLALGILGILSAIGIGLTAAPVLLVWHMNVQSQRLLPEKSTPAATKLLLQETQYRQLLAASALRAADPVLSLAPELSNTLTTLVDALSLQTRIAIRRQTVNYLATQSLQRALGTLAGDPYSDLPDIGAHLDNIYTDISLNQKQLEPQTITHQFKVGEWLSKTSSQITDEKDRLMVARQITSLVPRLSDPNKKTTFLVLLQNNLELRPTGGFISAIGLLTFDHGRLLDVEVKDVYAADSALQGRVDPPPGVQRYLGEGNWYLRDVNWDPHFPTTAKNASWFVQKELNRTADGVVGLNLYSLKSLLAAVGPITLEDGQTVSADNLEETAEYFQDVDVANAGSGKKELLSQVFSLSIAKLKTASALEQRKFLESILESAQTGQLQLYSANRSVNQALSAAGISGELINPTCPSGIKSTSCMNDYLSVVEANVGINKANYTISRRHEHTINLSGKVATHTHSLTLYNTAQSAAWPSGAYKVYLRFYTPENSQLIRILVDGETVPDDQITVSGEHGKTVIGVYTEVPISKSQNIQVSYQLDKGLPTNAPSAYTFLMQKQSGTGDDPFSLKITYPQAVMPVTVSHPTQPSGNNLDISDKLDKNFFFAVEFTP